MSNILDKLTGTSEGKMGFDEGASGAQKTQDLSDGLFEDPQSTSADNIRSTTDHHGGKNPAKAFTSQGSVGSQFNPEGPAGGTAEKAGGPFDREGAVGKQFTSDGAIGGAVDKILGEK